MNRFAFVLFALCAPAVALGEPICPDAEQKSELADDMRIPEEDFTLEAAEDALDSLADLIRAPRTELSWISEGNAITFVRGWLLKKAAIESLEKKGSNIKSPEVQSFCDFLETKAFYYD